MTAKRKTIGDPAISRHRTAAFRKAVRIAKMPRELSESDTAKLFGPIVRWTLHSKGGVKRGTVTFTNEFETLRDDGLGSLCNKYGKPVRSIDYKRGRIGPLNSKAHVLAYFPEAYAILDLYGFWRIRCSRIRGTLNAAKPPTRSAAQAWKSSAGKLLP